MSLILFLILLALTGLITGALARLALPGPDPMSIGQTILLGIAGSLTAGLITGLLWHRGAGIVVSVLVSTLILYVMRRREGGSLTQPGTRGRGR